MNPDFNPYYVYIVYAMGALGLFLIGHRKWYGFACLAVVHSIFATTGVFLGLPWLAFGNVTYVFVDLVMAWYWWHRGRREAQAARDFVRLIRTQFADGKREAIHELMRLERDIQELAGGNPYPFVGGRRKEDKMLEEFLRDQEKHAKEIAGDESP